MSFRDDEDLSFDDVFGDTEMNLAPLDSPSVPKSKLDVQDTTPVSALTLKFEGMEIESAAADGETVLPDVASKWTQLRNISEEGVTPRMGSSAPVWIPQSRLDLDERRLFRIREEDEIENKRKGDFIPPHLTVERPVIQFSLNSGIAEKRALFRTREKILTMLGVNDACDVCFTETSDFHIPTTESGGLTRNFIKTQKAA